MGSNVFPWLSAPVQGVTCTIIYGGLDHHSLRYCNMNQFRLIKYKDTLMEALGNTIIFLPWKLLKKTLGPIGHE